MRNRPEILAPAGSPEALRAGVENGADAVYLGLQGFNARANATNFTTENLPEAVAYCHARGVRVYLTLNTLLLDRELPRLAAMLQAAAQAGVDAAIVQDLAVVALARRFAPGLPLHASTQMTLHNTPGFRAALALGFSRVVAPRELARQEIATLCRLGRPEVEVFVHGAHCMSVSGQCAFSAVLGGRSGNRGNCAQPCRLPARGAAGEYALSLKDLSLLPHLQALAGMGVASFKIEGRMKGPDYVAAAVAACRSALQGEKPDMENLRMVFSREGFTDSYFQATLGSHMLGRRTQADLAATAQVRQRLSAPATPVPIKNQPAPPEQQASVPKLPVRLPKACPARPFALRLRLQNAEQLFPEAEQAGLISLPLGELERQPRLIQKLGSRLVAELPPVLFEQQHEKAFALLQRLAKGGLAGVSIGNLAQLEQAKALGLTLHGGYSLNIFNSLALEEYAKLGLADATLSYELKLRQIADMRACLPCGILAYGHLPVMLTRNCPVRGKDGCSGCNKQRFLTDRKGNRIPVDCAWGLSTLYNPHVLYLAHRSGWQKGLSFGTLYFTRETREQCRKVYQLYSRGGEYGGKFTTGLYF